MLTDDGPLWQRAIFIYALFVLMMTGLLAVINLVWDCLAAPTHTLDTTANTKIREQSDMIYERIPDTDEGEGRDPYSRLFLGRRVAAARAPVEQAADIEETAPAPVLEKGLI